jgi:prevent-host-death family protein
MSIDLQQGVVPISAVAAQLARLLRQAQRTNAPIVVTQKGYPSGVILSLDAYLELKAAAEAGAVVAAQLRRRQILEQANEGYAALAAEDGAP